MTTSVKVIADSMGWHGSRLTTLELSMPRFILAQFNKHASIRSCAQSSRAIPVEKLIDKADYAPRLWAANRRGMQPAAVLACEDAQEATVVWREAKVWCMDAAFKLNRLGVHKQWVNRLLEPFSYVSVVATATEWETFFRLRLAHDAQDEMRELAEAMRVAMDASTPRQLGMGDWHLPYFDPELDKDVHTSWLPRVCAARCARVSYLTHDGKRDVSRDLALCDQLIKDKHRTPFEMVAFCESDTDWCGAYKGWTSLRHDLAFEERRMIRTVTWREVDG